MSEENKAFVRSWLVEVISKRNFKIFDEYMALSWNEDFKRFLVNLSVSFPDWNLTIERQIAEGDWVATWTTTRATHKGTFLGIPPTGKQVEWRGMSFDRLADGKIVEHSSVPDFLVLQRDFVQKTPILRSLLKSALDRTVERRRSCISWNKSQTACKLDTLSSRRKRGGRWSKGPVREVTL